MLEKVKLFLWKIGLWPDKCPYCGSKLKPVGFPKDFYQHYVCPNRNCKFNNRE